MLGAVTEREDVRDVYLPRPGTVARRLDDLPPNASVATGSLRRRCQLLHRRPDLTVIDVRGNVNTRYAKLEASSWDGMVLAQAGVVRLGWSERIGESIDPLVVCRRRPGGSASKCERVTTGSSHALPVCIIPRPPPPQLPRGHCCMNSKEDARFPSVRTRAHRQAATALRY